LITIDDYFSHDSAWGDSHHSTPRGTAGTRAAGGQHLAGGNKKPSKKPWDFETNGGISATNNGEISRRVKLTGAKRGIQPGNWGSPLKEKIEKGEKTAPMWIE